VTGGKAALGLGFALVAVLALASGAHDAGGLHGGLHGRIWLPAAGLAVIALMWRCRAGLSYSRATPGADRIC